MDDGAITHAETLDHANWPAMALLKLDDKVQSVGPCAAYPPTTTHCATRSLGARSSPRCSGAPATLWLALERFFASPCPPTNIVGVGRLSEVFAALLARPQPAGLLETARPRRCDTRSSSSAGRVGCGGEHVVPRLVSALWVACGGDPGGYRYLRSSARATVCGA